MYQRLAENEVMAAMEDTPVVLIHGPRQAGKSTLSKLVGKAKAARYVTLDDPIPRSLAVENPQGFIHAYPGPVIIDEVQRAPGLFLAIKSAVDRDRTPGRFLLTGSANVLALPKIADSLAGRIAIVDLMPLSQGEIEGSSSDLLDRLFQGEPPAEGADELSLDDLLTRICNGGFPEPLGRSSASRRDAWFADYVRTLLERDVRDLANIEGLAQMPRVLKLIAARVGSAVNVVDLSRETQIPNTSLHRYLDLLQAVFLTQSVPAWSNDGAARLTKTAKTFLTDTGLLCYLLNLSPSSLKADADRLKPVLENFVAMELRKICLYGDVRPALFHLRTVRRLEVDLVLEDRGGEVVGFQVRTSATVRPQDAEGLELLRELAGKSFRSGVVLYAGSEIVPLGKNIYAAPVSALWRKSPSGAGLLSSEG
jgi:predicted AAA+ superfamily ATPase